MAGDVGDDERAGSRSGAGQLRDVDVVVEREISHGMVVPHCLCRGFVAVRVVFAAHELSSGVPELLHDMC